MTWMSRSRPTNPYLVDGSSPTSAWHWRKRVRALDIFLEFDDWHGAAVIYRQLGSVAVGAGGLAAGGA